MFPGSQAALPLSTEDVSTDFFAQMSEEPPAWKHQREEMHWEYGKNTCSNSAPELLWWHARFYFNFHHQCGTFTATTAVDTPENWQILTVLQRLPLKTRHVAGSATRALTTHHWTRTASVCRVCLYQRLPNCLSTINISPYKPYVPLCSNILWSQKKNVFPISYLSNINMEVRVKK